MQSPPSAAAAAPSSEQAAPTAQPPVRAPRALVKSTEKRIRSTPKRRARTSRQSAPWPPWDSTPAPRAKTEAEEIAELRLMIKQERPLAISHAPSPPETSSQASRPKWNTSPLRNPPAALRGVRPVTNEPWVEVQEADIESKLDYGHEWEYEPKEPYSSFIEEARMRREENQAQKPWNSSPVRHVPPTLRGQQLIRQEPWSASNDDISFLNAIDGVSVNEFYSVTEDRDNRVQPTILQPDWDKTVKLGRPSTEPGMPGYSAEEMAHRKYLAAQFRAARSAGAPEGGPAIPLSTRRARGKAKPLK